MAIFKAHTAVNTQRLAALAQVDDPTEGAVSLNTPPNPDSVTFFQSANPLHIVLISDPSDIEFVAAQASDGTITRMTVTNNGQAAFEASGFSFKLADLYFDAFDDHFLETIPAQIFAGNDTINGSPFNDYLAGFNGVDVIRGGIGNDILRGGRGGDDLAGGTGKDHFFFNDSLGPADTIRGFVHVDDTIHLDPSLFRDIQGTGNGPVLLAANFRVGTHALDGNDRIIYNTVTGVVFYDRDGSGAAFHQVKFATLANAPDNVDNGDFLLILN
jgi:Ca2+-binding RTX toxin-like protein